MKSISKSSWRDVSEAELAAKGKGIVRGNVSKQAPEGSGMPQDARSAEAVASKYRNVKTIVDGIRFDSRREANYWVGLKIREAAGEITELRRQVRFPLYCPELWRQNVGDVLATSAAQVAEYVADFTYKLNGELMVVDAKARRISPYPLKRKWLALQHGIDIIEV